MIRDVRNRPRAARLAGAASLLVAGAIGGGVLAGSLSANAASTDTSGTSSSSTSTAPARQTFPAHGTAAHEALEKPVTGTNADKAKAAAVKAVGSGTAGDVTTDASQDGYEVTVKKSDGSSVEVHLNGSFAVDDHGRQAG